MAIASRVTSVGTYLANGSFDEVTYSPSNLTDSKNLFTNSQDFSAQGYWTQSGNSYLPVSTYDVAPDGSYTASLFTGLGQYPNVQKFYSGFVGISAQPGEVYTFSVYLKYVNQPVACLVQENGWNGYYVIVNIQTGTLVSAASNVTSYSITNVGNGWNRYSMTVTVPSIQASWTNGAHYYYNTTPPIPIAQFNPQIRLGNYDGTNYAGKQMLVWGAQLELSSTPTIYQPTGIPKNYLKFTQDFTKTTTNLGVSGAWGLDNVVTTGNAIVAPDGTMTGTLVTSTITGGNNTGIVNQIVTTYVNNTNYTYSIYLKKGTSPTTLVDFYNSNPYNEITATVTWGTTPSMVTGTGSGGVVVASSFTSVGDGWYRVSLTINTLNNIAQLVCRVYVRGQGTNNVAGETVYVWGAQLEQSSSPGPYVSNGINITKINQLNQVFNNNILTFSQTFSNAAWVKSLVSLGSTTTAPDGTLTAVKVINSSDASAQFHSIGQSFTIAVAGTYTFSIFVKAAELTNVGIYQNSGANGTKWDLSTQSLLSTDGGVTATFNAGPNGWFRITNTYTYASAGTYSVSVFLMNPGTSYVGNGTSGLFIWGAQLEYGSKITPYQNNLATITPVLSYTQPTTKTTSDGTVYVSGSYDEVTYNPTNVNLLEYTQQLDVSSYWFQGTSCTVLPNVINAPNNTLTADKIVQNTTNSRHGLQSPGIPVIANTAYTVSCYAKAGENNFVQLVYGKYTAPFTRGGSVVDLTTGAVTNYVVGSPTLVVRGTPEFVGNGWWYIYLTVIIDATSIDGYVEVNTVNSSSNGSGYIGSNSTDGTNVWGVQLEKNTKATTYQVIPPASAPPNLYNLIPSYTNTMIAANGWGVGPNTAYVGSTTAPDGSATAVTYTGNGSGANEFIVKNITYAANQTYTASVYARLAGGTVPTNGAILTISYNNGIAQTRSVVPYSGNLTSTWQRFSTTYTNINAGTYSAFFAADQTNTANIDIWGAQVEQGNTATIYQGIRSPNTLVTGFAKRDTQAGITYVTDEFDDFTKFLPVTNGLILNLDATSYNSGTIWQNQTENSYNATLVNNPAYSSANGGILQFNGTSKYVTTNIPSNTFTPSSNWTMSTWVRFNATNNSLAYLNPRPDGLGFFGTSGNLLGCIYYGNYGLFWATSVFNNVRSFYAGSMVRTGPTYAESRIETSNLTFGVWYNVTGVYDYTGNSHKLYINGALVNTGPVVTTGTFQNFASVPFIVSGTDAVFGGSGGGKTLDGDLGQNLIYNRALTAQEVLDNYNALRGRYSSSDEFTGKVVNGLVAYYDPAYSSSYSGVGATLYNLVDGVAATLNGTYSASTTPVGSSVAGNQTIRLTNSDLVAAGNNISHIQAPSFTNITTVSIWFYQHTYNGISRYILDGRTGGSEGWIYNGSIGSNWSTGIAYVNGGSSSGTPAWSNWGGDQTGVWKNVTFIANTPFTDDINIFSRFTDNEGLDVTFGAILIYNRVLTQAENAQNFNALRGRYGI
jgi:hypothetical protein